tara:strand:- start:2090 stop:2476 length:387 start_codon:yes stop_codon:yes gene_type:complete
MEEANIVVVENYDNNSANPFERLTGTIGLMREALDVIQETSIERMVVITDQSSTKGAMRKGTTSGVALDDVHGLGSLTVEVLSRMAANMGVKTRVYRIQSGQVQDALAHIHSFLDSDEDSPVYEVVSQ